MSLQGSFGFSGPRVGGNVFQRLIKFFTDSKWSHSFVVGFPENGEDAVFEAGMSVHKCLLSQYRNDKNVIYEIYHVTTGADVDVALMSIFKSYAEVSYGFLQLTWFPYAWVIKHLGFDVRKQKNWMTDGVICSELVYDYLVLLLPKLKELQEFNPDIIQPQDLYQIVKAHPEIFALVESK